MSAFAPKADMFQRRRRCPLSAKSRHLLAGIDAATRSFQPARSSQLLIVTDMTTADVGPSVVTFTVFPVLSAVQNMVLK
jgi:hypothetical protein